LKELIAFGKTLSAKPSKKECVKKWARFDADVRIAQNLSLQKTIKAADESNKRDPIETRELAGKTPEKEADIIVCGEVIWKTGEGVPGLHDQPRYEIAWQVCQDFMTVSGWLSAKRPRSRARLLEERTPYFKDYTEKTAEEVYRKCIAAMRKNPEKADIIEAAKLLHKVK
jgi:hypothetical protein